MIAEDATQKMMEVLLPRISREPLVLDAVALSALRGGRFRFSADSPVLLTPNFSEIARLTGDTRDAVERDPTGVAAAVSRTLNAVVALKGPRTYIATPDGELFEYTTGKVGLATSGSGNVLAGIALDCSPAERLRSRPGRGLSISTVKRETEWRARRAWSDFLRVSCCRRYRR